MTVRVCLSASLIQLVSSVWMNGIGSYSVLLAGWQWLCSRGNSRVDQVKKTHLVFGKHKAVCGLPSELDCRLGEDKIQTFGSPFVGCCWKHKLSPAQWLLRGATHYFSTPLIRNRVTCWHLSWVPTSKVLVIVKIFHAVGFKMGVKHSCFTIWSFSIQGIWLFFLYIYLWTCNLKATLCMYACPVDSRGFYNHSPQWILPKDWDWADSLIVKQQNLCHQNDFHEACDIWGT